MNPDAKPPYGFIACRIVIPDMPGLMPPGNLIGAFYLYQILKSAMAAQTQGQSDPSFAGSLNRCNFVFQVNEVAPALLTLDAVLKICLLRDFTTILYYDVAELIWRVKGTNAANVQRDFSLEQIGAEQLAIVARLTAHRDACILTISENAS